MELFERAHIYVIIDLDGSNSLRFWRNGEPGVEWDNALLSVFKGIYDNFQRHPNTLGFRMLLRDRTEAALKDLPKKRAFLRDMKEYARSKGYRNIPIGVDGYDNGGISIFEYMSCGDAGRAADFYTLNVGTSLPPEPDEYQNHLSLKPSPEYFDELSGRYHQSSIPILLRYGYKAEINHTFDEVQAVYSRPMTEVFSGVIFLQWYDQKQVGRKDTGKFWPSQCTFRLTHNKDLGLVDVSGQLVTYRSGYSALSRQLALIHPTIAEMGPVATANPRPSCHNLSIIHGQDTLVNISSDVQLAANLPPKSYPQLCSCMLNSLNCRAYPNASLSSNYANLEKLCKEHIDWCRGVRFDSATGEYDSFSSCELEEKLSWVFNRAYLFGNNDSMACTSVGGLIQQQVQSTTSDCQILLRQAGPNGTGMVTLLPTTESAPINPTTTATTSSGISIGERVAIVAGAITAICLLLTYLVIRFRVQKRKKPALNEDEGFQKPELPDNSNSHSERRELHSDDLYANELDGAGRFELEVRHIVEMQGNGISEMQGDDGLIELAAGGSELTEVRQVSSSTKG
jgi:hypothetical protein